jgi:hypothetical protein
VTASTVRLEELHIGDLLAEGGEGRVFELPRQPHLVLKRYRRPAPREFLGDLVAWPSSIDALGMAGRLRAATAWPVATVIGGVGASTSSAGTFVPGNDVHRGEMAAGVLLPRAPRRFALRHREGTTRLASLSYLTSDPLHGAVAYGLSLPDAVSPERLGLIYALARLLEAFESASPAVGHGDLSTKNVLWSVQRGPEVFVLDCDNCDRFGLDGLPLAPGGRRRAMTPNWEDPAVRPGANPTIASDRYSLALIFLRVVGAANFPIQSRQREGEAVAVDFGVPPGRFGEALLGPGAALFGLCERGLSVSDPPRRPGAGEWVATLEDVLGKLGALGVLQAVRSAQDGIAATPVGPSRRTGARPSAGASPSAASRPVVPGDGDGEPRAEGGGRPVVRPGASGKDPEVVIRPVVAPLRPTPRLTLLASQAVGPAWRRSRMVTAAGTTSAGLSMAARSGPQPGPAAAGRTAAQGRGGSIAAQGWAYLVQAAAWWAAFHRRTARALLTSGRRADGLRHVALCALLDLAVALVALFVVAMIVSPVLGI